jgi:hypothetical protein
MASIACERIEGDNSGSKPSTSQFGFRLGASVRAIAIALKCPHPGCDRATLKHSRSINDLCSSGMASPIWQKSFLARRKRPARYSGWLSLRFSRAPVGRFSAVYFFGLGQSFIRKIGNFIYLGVSIIPALPRDERGCE